MGLQELGTVFERVCVDADALQGTPVIKIPFLISRCPSETTLKRNCASKMFVRKFIIQSRQLGDPRFRTVLRRRGDGQRPP
jgi:hypothetical protein